MFYELLIPNGAVSYFALCTKLIHFQCVQSFCLHHLQATTEISVNIYMLFISLRSTATNDIQCHSEINMTEMSTV